MLFCYTYIIIILHIFIIHIHDYQLSEVYHSFE